MLIRYLNSFVLFILLLAAPSIIVAQQRRSPVIVRNVKSESARDEKLEAAIFSAILKNSTPTDGVRYYYNRVDLNGDKRPEVMVFAFGQSMCAWSGCTAYIFQADAGGYKLITEFGPAKNPIIVSQHKTRGWNDLIMPVSGGDIEPDYYALLRFDGNSYPENPTVKPAAPLRSRVRGTAYMVGNYSPKSGLALPRGVSR